MKKIKKILIANRSEIAVRIARACREIDIKTVAVYSDVDRMSMHVRYMDEAYYIGDSPASESYLKIDNIIAAAKKSGADAIHPGYGFLAENIDFVEACEANGIIFIGPSRRSMYLLGDKTRARSRMKEAGVPIVPGTTDAIKSYDGMRKDAEMIGYPIMLKASGGGGGKGIRLVDSEDELKSAFELASSEARSAFADGRIYIEKAIINPRHIEVQIARDNFGNILVFPERECSIQRRHQKVIEESPATIINSELRKKIGAAAAKAADASEYNSVGTVEFLMDKDLNFYFLEVNTRLQVEHPVTEMVTGIDLVKLQIEIAENKKIEIDQTDVRINGHAIECRIYAEDTERNFMPSPGTVIRLRLPNGAGVRNDNGIYEGDLIPIFYDPIISKLIVWGSNREEAIKRMQRALSEYLVRGIKTTIPFHRKALEDKSFINGNISTEFAANIMKTEKKQDKNMENIAVIAAAILKDKIGTEHYSDKGIKSSVSNWWQTGIRMAVSGVPMGQIIQHST